MSMTAVEVLDTIIKAGVIIVPGPDRPRLRVPAAVSDLVKPLVQEHREGLRRLIVEHSSKLEAAYRKFWSLPETTDPETFSTAYREIALLETRISPDVAWWVLRATATAFHRESGICPFCRVKGALHLPAAQRELELTERP